jgi:hypothetical protein
MDTLPDSPTSNHPADQEQADGAPNTGQPSTLVLQVIMAALILLLFTSSLVLLQQVRGLSYQTADFQNAAQELSPVAAEFETNAAAQISKLHADLTQFAEKNPEFARIHSKYRVVSEMPRTVAPVVTPGPGVTPNPAQSRQ